MKEILARPVVSVIAVNEENGLPLILIQRRTKGSKNDKYFGIWELPQGKIRSGESIFSVTRRELLEETGLHAIALDERHIYSGVVAESKIASFFPLICVFDLENNYIGLAVVVKTRGTPYNTKEASEHRWVGKSEIMELMVDNNVFPLNVPMLTKYFENE